MGVCYVGMGDIDEATRSWMRGLLDLITAAGYFDFMMVNPMMIISIRALTSRGFSAGSFCASGALLFNLLDLRLPFGSK